MLIIPNSNIKILKCPLNLDNENQLTFSNLQAQFNYFNSLPKIEEFDYTYVRRDNVLRVSTNENLTYENLLNYNYVMYQNEGFNNKWFYAHITSYTWINPELTILTLEEDFFQSWQFDIVYENSFIEREHVTDDTIGLHTVPENLETGDFIINSSSNSGVGSCHAVVVTNYDIINKRITANGIQNGVPSGFYYYVVGNFTSYTFLDWMTDAVVHDNDLNPEMIQGIYMVPDTMTGYDESDNTYWNYAYNTGGLSYAPYHRLDDYKFDAYNMMTVNLSKNTTLNGYVPKNNKLLTGAYNYLLVDNNGGTTNIYNYEYFSSSNCVFTSKGTINQGCSIKLTPNNYKGITNNYTESINLCKLPVGAWSCDMYTNWLTQNSINIAGIDVSRDELNMVNSAVSLGASLGAGDLSGAISSGVSIANNLMEQKAHNRIPPLTRGNINSSDVVYAMGLSEFSFYKMSIKQEYARIIDDYFEHYGYRVNTFKTLSVTGRPYFNYVKTTQCELEGDIPTDALENLKGLFNRGCTFWHDTNNFLNYNVNNH